LLFGRKKPQNSESGLGEEAYGLKREVGVWGSFSMGYADVGADVYVALGILALYAHAAAPIALLLASITYVTTGLTYAELSTKYPVAGGGQFYALKAFGPLHGFLAGWGLMLDYTIDIALFALATSGYLSALSSVFTHTGILLQPPWYSVIAIVVIAALLLLNISGIRYSSKFNELVVALNIVTFVVIVALGLYTVFASGGFARWTSQLEPNFLTSDNFVYSLTLAMASFIGIESISQAAEETKSPNKVIPKSTKLSIVAVMTVALALSFLSVSLQPWQVTASSAQNPLFSLTASLPVIGLGLSAWVAVTGFLMSAVSTNTGVIGVSRVTFSMGRLDLMPRAFSSCFDSSIISGVKRVVLDAYFLISATSPSSRASSYLFWASSFIFLLSSRVFLFNSGGVPSNTYIGNIFFISKFAFLVNIPMRWLVTFPEESIRSEPSGCLIVVRN